MAKRNWFGTHEAAEIKALIDELRHADDAAAKGLRARLRSDYGFYVGEYVLDASHMTHGDFDDLVHRGRVRLVEDAATGVELTTPEDESFWLGEAGVVATSDRTGARCWFPSREAAEAAGATLLFPTG